MLHKTHTLLDHNLTFNVCTLKDFILHTQGFHVAHSRISFCTLKDFMCAKLSFNRTCAPAIVSGFSQIQQDWIHSVFLKELFRVNDTLISFRPTTKIYEDLSFRTQRLTNCAGNSHNSSNQNQAVPSSRDFRVSPDGATRTLLPTTPLSMQITPQIPPQILA